MLNRSSFMKSVWTRFHRVAIPGRPFDRKLFAQCLTFMWKPERRRILADREATARRAEPVINMGNSHNAPRPMSEMERRTDGLKYLSARYRIDLMEREIRAEYGA